MLTNSDAIIKQFGHHFKVLPEVNTVREYFGEHRPHSELEFSHLQDALNAAFRRKQNANSREMERIRKEQYGRWTLWCARNGLLSPERSRMVLKHQTDMEHRFYELQEKPPRAEIARLPDQINAPRILPQGADVYCVQASWIQKAHTPLAVYPYTIKNRVIRNTFAEHAPFDVEIAYYVDDAWKEEREFVFNTDNPDDTEIPWVMPTQRVFTTLEAAQECAQNWAMEIYSNISDWLPLKVVDTRSYDVTVSE